MLRERLEAAQVLAGGLHTTESHIDEALTAAAELLADLSKKRRELRLSAVFGSDVFEVVSKAINDLSNARSTMVEAHHRLSKVQGEMGLGARAFGPWEEKPTKAKIGQLRANDRIAAINDQAAA